MIEVKAYQCSHCGKKRFSKSGMKSHEKVCFYNEDKRACVSCLFFKSDYDHRSCLKHQDLTGKLKSDCALWVSSHECIEELLS